MSSAAPFAIPLEAGSAPYSFEDLQRYIVGEYKEFYAGDCSPNTKTTTTGDPPVTTTSNLDIGIEGWYRELTGLRERVVGQPTLLGGLTTFSSYIPFDDACTAEGLSNLYFVHFQTGTAWTEEVYGLTGGYTYGTNTDITTVNDKLFLGRGLATTPSVHLGTGEGHDAKIVIQKSTGEIIEMEQFNLPIKNIGSGKLGWTDQCE
ncbi:hypothetical protein ACFL0S_12495 [Thermodesulfobacteriota bacterium]